MGLCGIINVSFSGRFCVSFPCMGVLSKDCYDLCLRRVKNCSV